MLYTKTVYQITNNVLNHSSLPCVAAPPPVENLTSTNQTLQTITLSWERPNTMCEVTEYHLLYYGYLPDDSESNYENRNNITINGTENEVLIYFLPPNALVMFSMTAVNGNGKSPASNISVYTERKFLFNK